MTGASGDSLDALSRPRLAGLDIASNSREEKEEEEYSDLEDSELGRVDVRDVGKLDWMAPEALRKTARTDSRRNSVGIREPSCSLSFCLVTRGNMNWGRFRQRKSSVLLAILPSSTPTFPN